MFSWRDSSVQKESTSGGEREPLRGRRRGLVPGAVGSCSCGKQDAAQWRDADGLGPNCAEKRRGGKSPLRTRAREFVSFLSKN